MILKKYVKNSKYAKKYNMPYFQLSSLLSFLKNELSFYYLSNTYLTKKSLKIKIIYQNLIKKLRDVII